MARKRVTKPVKGQGSDPDGDDENIAVYVRLSKRLLEEKEVTRAIGEMGSRKAFFERLISAFLSSAPADQDQILQRFAAFKTVGNQLARASWSGHAFALEHWAWAVTCYRQIARDAKEFDSEEQRAFALYREGYAWNELGLSLRREALRLAKHRPRDFWTRDFDASFECVVRGMECTREMPDQASVPRAYNLACSHAQLAQLLVERALRQDGDWATMLARENDAGKAWAAIGAQWRDLMAKEKKVWAEKFHAQVNDEKVNEHVDKSLGFLRETTEVLGERAGAFPVPWPDPEFFKRLAHKDSDLVFIREDSEAKKRFTKRFGDLSPEDHDDWHFKSYENLVQAISDEGGSR